MVIDTLFLLASCAFGLGLSLATYRLFALRNGWPMGEVQADQPVVAALIGLLAVAAGFLFAASRGSQYGGWSILIVGLVLAFVWTGVLRVGSQISLFLAPVATILLLLGWAHLHLPGSDSELIRNRTYYQPKQSSALPPQRAGTEAGPGSSPAASSGAGSSVRPLARPASSLGGPVPGGAAASRTGPWPEIRDARDLREQLPAAPNGWPRPFEPDTLSDPAPSALRPKLGATGGATTIAVEIVRPARLQ